jgi:AcrR family transcriptional regulator
MGRPAGARNRDFEATRMALAGRLLPVVMRRGARASLLELSRAARVSLPTMRHYFGDRSGALAAAMRAATAQGAPYLARLAHPGRLGLRRSLDAVARDLAAAWLRAPVGRLFTLGLAAGAYDEAAGPGYLDGILEPTVQALEARLRVHAGRGQLSADGADELAIRTAALAFLSPLLVALIHQVGLAGTRCRPLPLDAFAALHLARFCAAWATPARQGRRSARRRPGSRPERFRRVVS